jgi:outer membrane assembly lipoprotein YfiO
MLSRAVLPLILMGMVAPIWAETPIPATQPQVDPSIQQTQLPKTNPTLDRTEALIEARQAKSAHDLLVPWLKAFPQAPDRDRGLYDLARIYIELNYRLRAFYHLDELLDNFPASRLYYPALELQYDIADGYLSGYKETFLGLHIVPATDEAIEMLYRVQERSPGSPIAERALKRSADYYFSTSQFDLAGDAYEFFVRSYPRSAEVPQAKLRRAFASLAQFRSPKFDATPLIDARLQFKAIQAQYPELAAEANVSQWIDHIDADLARKAYITGDFFKRTNSPGAAVYMFRYVRQTYPNSTEARQAEQQLKSMPRWALEIPPPPNSNPEAAAQPLPSGSGEPNVPPVGRPR